MRLSLFFVLAFGFTTSVLAAETEKGVGKFSLDRSGPSPSRRRDWPPHRPGTVTLEVTPEEGVMLSLAAKDKDGFYFMLRNTKDSATGKLNYKQTREVIKEEGN